VAPITNGASAEKATRETTMKAIQFSRFGGPEVLEYVDLPRPVPKGDEVIIEVTASGVNFQIFANERGSISVPKPMSAALPCLMLLDCRSWGR
jgi:hypothetical protein